MTTLIASVDGNCSCSTVESFTIQGSGALEVTRPNGTTDIYGPGTAWKIVDA